MATQPTHGQLLAYYFLLLSDSQLRRDLMKSTSGDAPHDATSVESIFTQHMQNLFSPATPPPTPLNVGDIYIGGAYVLSQDTQTTINALGLTGYDPASGPCPGKGAEEMGVINALDQAFHTLEPQHPKSHSALEEAANLE
jgi:hypothetical protein